MQEAADDMKERIEAALDLVRPALARDGGDVAFVSAEGGQVRLRFTGACASCAMSSLTLRFGLEKAILQAVPGITQVVAVP